MKDQKKNKKKLPGSRAFWIFASLIVVVGGFSIWLFMPEPVQARPPTQSEYKLTPLFDNASLLLPVWMEQHPTNDERWYAVEQQGRIVEFTDSTDKKLVLDLTDRVLYGGEQGLLGFAFSPSYSNDQTIYVNYITAEKGPKRTVVSAFKNWNPESEKIVLEVEQPYSNHNGGQIAFGPDGYLYVAMGDGGLAGDPKGHGQNKETLLGAMLRIDPNSVKGGYTVPKDNPFAKTGGAKEIYAWGLRNPWRFSWDTKTKKLWAGDVGQNAYEEIDIIELGKNYGWNGREGQHCYDPPAKYALLGKGDCESKSYVEPIHEYPQTYGDRSITGGYVYRGTKDKWLVGQYVYGDFASGRIWAFNPTNKKETLLIDGGLSPSTFVQARDGELGVISYTDGTIYHITRK